MNADERGAVDAHLSLCPSCREETAAIRAMGAFLRERGPAALPPHTPAPDLWERIEGRIVTEQRESRRAFSLRPVLLFAPALAAVIVAVVLAPKQQGQHQQHFESVAAPGPSGANTAKANRAGAAKKPVTMVAMEESRTARPASDALPAPMPSVSLTPPTQIKIAARRLTAAPSSSDSGAAVRRRTGSAGFVAVTKVVPRPRDTQSAKRIAQSVPPLKTLPSTITIVDVDASTAPVMVASARGRAATELRPVAPAASSAGEENLADRNTLANANTITVVRTDPGTGVSATAYAPPPVTDTMIRQRQRRGLFGGYGSNVVLGVLPGSGRDADTGSETGTPW